MADAGVTGRYAPSPTGDLHLGNLRTAVVAWAAARAAGGRFLVRVEDIDTGRCRGVFVERQLADLAAVGIDWDGPVLRQSTRGERYAAALDRLPTYPCWCSRREIREAASAPHGAPGAYPGTCRRLAPGELAERAAARRAAGLGPAIRLAAEVDSWTVRDLRAGEYRGRVDDMVLRRADGDWAYNLAVVVDDAEQGVTQVVRGADLLASAPRQAHLATLLGHRPPEYLHVPLVLGPTGARLAKRDGAVTLRELDPARARAWIMASLGMPGAPVARLPELFDPALLPADSPTLGA